MSGKRYDARQDSLDNVADNDSRYDISVPGMDTDRAFMGDAENSDTESADSDREKELSAEFIAADEAEMQAAAATLSRSNSETKANSEGLPEALLRRIASTLSTSPLKRSSTMLTVDSLKEAVEVPNKVVIPSQDMDINEEIAAAAADLDRCIQV